ncbi:outer membrane lipoprotein chaperone LolA [Agaribacter flavus]|uniref:Outer-membrane lipoprotein carrier protein n=1 Tax=Agaribacter flavus TaxID=1902781 RepID=A0ABV7FN61_9ALTE
MKQNKMPINRAYSVLTVCGIAINLFFASPSNAQVSEMSATENLRGKLRQINSYQAQFEQQIKDAQQELLLTSRGNIAIGKPSKLRWEVISPDESLLVADGEHVYNIDTFVEQVTILNQSELVQNNPLSLLISDKDDVWDKVRVSFKDNTYDVQSLDENANIVRVSLQFEGEKLVSLSSVDAQQQTNAIVFSNIRQNPVLELNLFSVDIPESYEVDDQR